MRVPSGVGLGGGMSNVDEIRIIGLRFGHSGVGFGSKVRHRGHSERRIWHQRHGSGIVPGLLGRHGVQNLRCCCGERDIGRLGRLQQLRPLQCCPQCRNRVQRHRGHAEDDGAWNGPAGLRAQLKPPRHRQPGSDPGRRSGGRGGERLCPDALRAWSDLGGAIPRGRRIRRFDYCRRYVLSYGAGSRPNRDYQMDRWLFFNAFPSCRRRQQRVREGVVVSSKAFGSLLQVLGIVRNPSRWHIPSSFSVRAGWETCGQNQTHFRP